MFLIENSLLGALCASAVQCPSPFTEIPLASLATVKPENPFFQFFSNIPQTLDGLFAFDDSPA
jgi:hypothetical protein